MITHPTDMRTLTVLICTHNRSDLLQRVIRSLNAANKPTDWRVNLFVVANACTDDTHGFLDRYTNEGSGLPLRWVAEQTPGKSHALNRALPLLQDALVAFVDDDHRVDDKYLLEVARAAEGWPEADLICGRILPDWDGSEPPWVHDEGPYRIYPLPVPRYDQGQETFTINLDGPIPGGGNLVARLPAIAMTGPFATELGPTGHDLGGSEDADWILRAMRNGATMRYAPAIIQYHYVDNERLTLTYIARKGYQRSQSVTRVRAEYDEVPRYMWRKTAGYAFRLVFSGSLQARRHFLVRLASSLGEISGIRDQKRRSHKRARLPLLPDGIASYALVAAAVSALMLAALIGRHWVGQALLATTIVSATVSAVLLAKSVRDFSRTGPTLRDEILQRYRYYGTYALARLTAFAFFVATFWAFPGAMLWIAATETLDFDFSPWGALFGATTTLIAATIYAGCRALYMNPGLIIASWQYRAARVHWLWSSLSPNGLKWIARLVSISGVALVSALALVRFGQGADADAYSLIFFALGYAGLLAFAQWEPAERVRKPNSQAGRPNLLMIGSDTLRADRIGAIRDGASLTPNIDRLAERGARFTSCYVPCARTAPSLISMLTGTWPHTHGVRDNFVADKDVQLKCTTLPGILRQLGYRTAAVSDWCGADLGKFDFGFDVLELPRDQWNLKYLIRQGPKDIRLFLSLFLHNRIGRLLLPEVYYLGGVPQTGQLGRRSRRMLSRLAETGDPFLLNVFYSTTHPPFASEYPFYLRYAKPSYSGESKFAMARLTDPFDIIRRQGEPREEFDLDQILDLYDGCVAQFDDEVGKTIRQLESSGLMENTVVVLYSDHGMEFFEHGTWGQGNSALGDFSARVPLLIADPRNVSPKRIDQVVRTIDLMPTLLDLLEAPSVKCDGTSLVPAIADSTVELRLKAFNETGVWIAPAPGLPAEHLRYPDLLQLLDIPDDSTGTLGIRDEYRDIVLTAKDRMIRDGPWKLVYQPLVRGKHLTLYNVEVDPGCTKDLSVSYPDQVRRLWSELSEWMKGDEVLRRDLRIQCAEVRPAT